MSRRLLTFAAVVLAFAGPVGAQQPRDLAPYLMTDRSAEIALARSSAPKHIADSATVMVLTRGGYVDAVKGSNGFVCFVQRSYDGPIGGPGLWDPAIRGPLCVNAPAARTVLTEMRKRAEWIMAGVSPAEIAKRTREGYASHLFPKPAAGAMAFMLSPEQHLANTDPHWVPHLMFWYDMSMPAAEWGVGGATNTIIDLSAQDPDSQVRLLLIPVRRWSDGKPAVPDGR